jgi:hypothetical protein
MTARKQVQGGSRFGRFKDRMAEAAGTAALSYTRGRRSFGPFVRLARPANDNRAHLFVLVFRGLIVGGLIALIASAVF